MYNFKIGVLADSFKLPLKESVLMAKETGVDGLQLYATTGELSPDVLGAENRRGIRRFIEKQGLAISALCGDLGGHGFEIEHENIDKIERSKKIVDLAVDLGTDIVTTHIGVIPEDPHCERYAIMQKACGALGKYADSRGVCFAIETGPEKADTLKTFLDKLSVKGIGVNLDPANFVMVTGDDPVNAVYVLKDYIVHTHAKDGIMLKQTDPKVVYDFLADGGIGDLRLGDYFLETPLGEGAVDFDKYLKALDDISFKGYLTIEREVGDNPQEDIVKAVLFLKNKNMGVS